MKELNLKQMRELQGGWRASVGCAIVGATMSIINPVIGFAYGLGCSLWYEYHPLQD